MKQTQHNVRTSNHHNFITKEPRERDRVGLEKIHRPDYTVTLLMMWTDRSPETLTGHYGGAGACLIKNAPIVKNVPMMRRKFVLLDMQQRLL